MKNIYENGQYLANNPTWHAEHSHWKAKQIIRTINRHGLKPTTICEVGCGSGEILNQLSMALNKDIRFYGYDISPQAFDICKHKASERLTFIQGDLLEDEGSHFDIVMAIDVFEHVEDYFGFLRRLKGKGTYKIFHIPLDLSVQTVLRSFPMIREREQVGHIHYFTKDTALATLKDTGYEILDYFYTRSAWELPDRGGKAALLRILRRLLFSANQDLAARILGGFPLLVLAK